MNEMNFNNSDNGAQDDKRRDAVAPNDPSANASAEGEHEQTKTEDDLMLHSHLNALLLTW